MKNGQEIITSETSIALNPFPNPLNLFV